MSEVYGIDTKNKCKVNVVPDEAIQILEWEFNSKNIEGAAARAYTLKGTAENISCLSICFEEVITDTQSIKESKLVPINKTYKGLNIEVAKNGENKIQITVANPTDNGIVINGTLKVVIFKYA